MNQYRLFVVKQSLLSWIHPLLTITEYRSRRSFRQLSSRHSFFQEYARNRARQLTECFDKLSKRLQLRQKSPPDV